MNETMTYETYIRSQIEHGSCGVTIIPNLVAKDIADLIEKKRDAVDVVRCIDCKWWKCADDSEIIKYGYCTHPSSAIRKNCLPNETWYCADGERNE